MTYLKNYLGNFLLAHDRRDYCAPEQASQILIGLEVEEEKKENVENEVKKERKQEVIQ